MHKVNKIRWDIQRYARLASAEKTIIRFTMKYHVGNAFKEIKMKALQSAAGTQSGYLLNSLNTYQRLAMINSIDVGKIERQKMAVGVLEEGSADIRGQPLSPSRPEPPRLADRLKSPLALVLGPYLFLLLVSVL